MPRVQVTMDEELYRALLELAEEQSRTPANTAKHAVKAYLSRYHKWECGTRGRGFAHTRKGL